MENNVELRGVGAAAYTSIGTPKRKVDQVDLDQNRFFVNFGKRRAFEFFSKSFERFVSSLNLAQVYLDLLPL